MTHLMRRATALAVCATLALPFLPASATPPVSYLDGCYSPTTDTTWVAGVIGGPPGVTAVAANGMTWVDVELHGWVNVNGTLPGVYPIVTAYSDGVAIEAVTAHDALGCPQNVPVVAAPDPPCPDGQRYSPIPPAGCVASLAPVVVLGAVTAALPAVRQHVG